MITLLSNLFSIEIINNGSQIITLGQLIAGTIIIMITARVMQLNKV